MHVSAIMVRVDADLMLSSLRDLHLTYVELGSSKVCMETFVTKVSALN